MVMHKGALHYSGPEYGDVWECDDDCPHPDHQDDGVIGYATGHSIEDPFTGEITVEVRLK